METGCNFRGGMAPCLTCISYHPFLLKWLIIAVYCIIIKHLFWLKSTNNKDHHWMQSLRHKPFSFVRKNLFVLAARSQSCWKTELFPEHMYVSHIGARPQGSGPGKLMQWVKERFPGLFVSAVNLFIGLSPPAWTLLPTFGSQAWYLDGTHPWKLTESYRAIGVKFCAISSQRWN